MITLVSNLKLLTLLTSRALTAMLICVSLTSCLFDAATNRLIPLKTTNNIDTPYVDPGLLNPIGADNIRPAAKSFCACNNVKRSYTVDYGCIKYCKVQNTLSNQASIQFQLGANLIRKELSLLSMCNGLNTCRIKFRYTQSSNEYFNINIDASNFPTSNPNLLVFNLPPAYFTGNTIKEFYYHIQKLDGGTFQNVTDVETRQLLGAPFTGINISYPASVRPTIYERTSKQIFRAKDATISNPASNDDCVNKPFGNLSDDIQNRDTKCQTTEKVVKFYYGENGVFSGFTSNSNGITMLDRNKRVDILMYNPATNSPLTVTQPLRFLSMTDSNAGLITVDNKSYHVLNLLVAEYKKNYLGQTGDIIWGNHFFSLPLPKRMGEFNGWSNLLAYLPEFFYSSLAKTVEEMTDGVANHVKDYTHNVGLAIMPIEVGQSPFGNVTKRVCPSKENITEYYSNIEIQAVSAALGNPVISSSPDTSINGFADLNANASLWQISNSAPVYLTCRRPKNELKYWPPDYNPNNPTQILIDYAPEHTAFNQVRIRALTRNEIFLNFNRYQLILPDGQPFYFDPSTQITAAGFEEIIESAYVSSILSGGQLAIRDLMTGEDYAIVGPGTLVDPTTCAVVQTTANSYGPIYACTWE